MQSKMTPGPWNTGGKNGTIIYADSSAYAVADATVYHLGHEQGATEANAQAIAAVPDLIEALDLCWQATGEAYAGDVSKGKLLSANRAAREALIKAGL